MGPPRLNIIDLLNAGISELGLAQVTFNMSHESFAVQNPSLALSLPADVCFSFSFFFFRHFHGLKILPSVASLLFLLTGGVRIPETK